VVRVRVRVRVGVEVGVRVGVRVIVKAEVAEYRLSIAKSKDGYMMVAT
jgi:hypothetical protein